MRQIEGHLPVSLKSLLSKIRWDGQELLAAMVELCIGPLIWQIRKMLEKRRVNVVTSTLALDILKAFLIAMKKPLF